MVQDAVLKNGIFADSFLETSWSQRTRRSWTTLTSFGLQAVAIGVLLLIPLLTNVVIPVGRALSTPLSLGAPPPPAAPRVPQLHPRTLVSNLVNDRVILPTSFPHHPQMIEETVAPPQVSYDNSSGVNGGTGSGGKDGIWNSISNPASQPQPIVRPPAPTTPVFRTSNMLQGSLIRQVQPVYPPLAKAARIQGSVVLAAMISKEGAIANLRLVSGHPMLVQSAIQAVSQWRYRPYILNGEAIEVETQITVNFLLSGN
jgi:periplasmic protein TonB